MIKIEYLSNFGYAIEFSDTILIIDYSEGKLPSEYLKSHKKMYFLVSTDHPEHFNPSILNYRKAMITSFDIALHSDQEYHYIQAGEMLHLGTLKLYAFGDQDRTLFYISHPEANVLHGGNFSSQYELENEKQGFELDEQLARKLLKLRDDYPVDISIVAVNPYAGENYDEKARFLVSCFKAKYIFPMNFGKYSDDTNSFCNWVEERFYKFYCMKHENKKVRISLNGED